MNKFDIQFWYTSTEEIFNNSFDVLIEKGFSEENAIIFLRNLYQAVGKEYGD